MHFSVYIPHTIQVWGIVAFILVRVLSEPPLDKRKVNSTLSLFIIIALFGVGGQKMRMKQLKQRGYLIPEIEVNEMSVEHGFLGSELGGVDSNPTNPSETPSLPGEDTDW